MDRASVGKEFLAKAGYSEGCRFALDRRQERMREWENSGNDWSHHGGRRPERQRQQTGKRCWIRYCSSVEGNLVMNKGELQYYDYSLVTFIPDCDRWECVSDLYNAICNSFGTSLTAVRWQIGSDLDKQLERLNTFVDAIDLILQRMDRRWVLIFDQINRLFSRLLLIDAKDLSTLPFPFSAINNIMKRGRRIVSIISASTNNEVAYKESHRGFEECNHPCNMDLK